MKKILVLTACDHNHEPLLEITKPVYEKYTERHGYYFKKKDIINFNKPQSWFKIEALIEYGESDYDYILWCDSDTIILNPAFKLESIIDKNKDLYISQDNLGLNCGVFLIKNSDTMRKFLKRIQSLYPEFPETHPLAGIWEQAAVWKLCYENYLNIRSLIKIIPQYVINAYDPETKPQEINGHVNDHTFILHLPNTPMQKRLELFRNYYNKYYIERKL